MLLSTKAPSVLIVEDDLFKLDSVRAYLLEAFPEGARTVESQSLASATRRLEEERFDLVIIDMSIHSHDPEQGSGSPVPLTAGGLDVLFEVASLQPAAICVILTQYTDIPIEGEPIPVALAAGEILEKFGISIAGCVQYFENEVEWKWEINEALGLR